MSVRDVCSGRTDAVADGCATCRSDVSPLWPSIQQVTERLVGKTVVGPNDEVIGRITGIEENEAILKADSPGIADREEAVSEGSGELALTPEQIVAVTDDEVQVSMKE